MVWWAGASNHQWAWPIIHVRDKPANEAYERLLVIGSLSGKPMVRAANGSYHHPPIGTGLSAYRHFCPFADAGFDRPLTPTLGMDKVSAVLLCTPSSISREQRGDGLPQPALRGMAIVTTMPEQDKRHRIEL